MEHKGALVFVGVALVVGACDGVYHRRIGIPGSAGVKVTRPIAKIRGMKDGEGLGWNGRPLIHKVRPETDAVFHARNARLRQQLFRRTGDRRVRIERNQVLQQVAVIVVERGRRVPRVIAGGDQFIQRGDDGVREPEQRGQGMRRLV